MKKQSPRAKFIEKTDFLKLKAYAWDAMRLASTHDPDHEKKLEDLKGLIHAEVKLQDRRFTDTCSRLSILECQMQRLGAPQYRTVRKGNVTIHVQRVRKPK